MITILDLFAGMGGFSYGLSKAGYKITGVDINIWTEKIFRKNNIGKVILKDLKHDFVSEESPDIIVGGPPCRPWSTLNLKKRNSLHADYELLDKYFLHIFELKPRIFVFENVLPVKKDKKIEEFVSELRKSDFVLFETKIKYSDFGAALARERFFIFGFYKNEKACSYFKKRLISLKKTPRTVFQVIGKYRFKGEKELPDHEWPKLKTIDKYIDKYRNGKFGWYILNWNKPSPSFGNVMKTYILHPDLNRVISIREAMAIFGFDDDFSFPEGMGKGMRYQMIADAVSPVFSFILGKLFKEILD